jgi:Ni,Fe-hydrogenase I large subunit
MITRHLIERIEGEAEVAYELDQNRVAFATIRFPHIRGMEKILQGRSALDALVVTPRTCGICGHSHLMATVGALESAYANAGVRLEVTPKARAIRELTLMLELVQNHFKWFYLVIYPELSKLSGREALQGMMLKGAFAASTTNRVLALLSGQWPHSSYAIPGGVTCDPTRLDLVRAESYLDEAIRFFETEFAGVSLEHFLLIKSCKEFNGIRSDMADVERMLTQCGMQEKGFGYDRFIILGEHGYANPSKIAGTVSRRAENALVETAMPYTPAGESRALNALYGGKYYETGPLARAMSMGYPLIKNIHRRFKDSAYSRVNARAYEVGHLLYRIKQSLRQIDITEPSYIVPHLPIRELSGEGEGVVEAPRGPLIHQVRLDAGTITDYRMITPTQWNLGSGTKEHPGVAQYAMIGSATPEEAEFIFRTFDVCSVCTTH